MIVWERKCYTRLTSYSGYPTCGHPLPLFTATVCCTCQSFRDPSQSSHYLAAKAMMRAGTSHLWRPPLQQKATTSTTTPSSVSSKRPKKHAWRQYSTQNFSQPRRFLRSSFNCSPIEICSDSLIAKCDPALTLSLKRTSSKKEQQEFRRPAN